MHLNSLNHFRAITIIIIVAGHSYSHVGLEFSGILDNSLKNMISGGTSLFVFISGFLFHHVFYKKFHYSKFVGKKVRNVLIPYLILGFLPALWWVILKQEKCGEFFLGTEENFISEYVVPMIKYYATGVFINGYWYVPFIMLTFSISPIHARYIKLSTNKQLSLILLLSCVSMVIHRPIQNVNVFQSVVYFTPVYLIGITASIHRNVIYNTFNKREYLLLLFAAALAVLQAYLGHEGNYHKQPLAIGTIDIMYLQKTLLCFFFMVWLHRFENYNNSYVHAVASTSFTAFFIHPYILWLLRKADLSFIKTDSWFVLLMFVAILQLTCVLIAKVTKKLIPKYSRFFIGY